MENLFGTIGESEVRDLLATSQNTKAVAVSMEPGNGKVPYGALIYRKSGVLYAPAAAANVTAENELLVLRDTVDTDTSETVAVAAAAFESGEFKAGKVKILNGTDYEPITAAQALILRLMGITFRPFDDWRENDVEADNTVADDENDPGDDNTDAGDANTDAEDDNTDAGDDNTDPGGGNDNPGT